MKWLVGAAAACVLAGCPESAPQLSQDEEKLLEAVMYLFTGLEDNLVSSSGKGTAWQRAVKGRTLEYWRISENGFGFSDDETNNKTRYSRYVRYAQRLDSPATCVFSFEEKIEFSKGASQDNFTAHSSTSSLGTMTFNLATAHTFAFEDADTTQPYIRVLGPRAVCQGQNYCENVWNSVFSNLSLGRFQDELHRERRQKAFAFVKKACPGNEF